MANPVRGRIFSENESLPAFKIDVKGKKAW
jgi:hypothetical protein